MGYSVYFLQQAGMDTARSFDISVAQYGLGALGTLLSWFAMQFLGRRTLYFYGLCALFVFLVVIGGMGTISEDNESAQWAIGAMLLVYTFTYDL